MSVHFVEKRWLLGFGMLALILPSCASENVDPIDDAACEKRLKAFENIDAIEWLKTPRTSPKWLGGMSDEQALALAMKYQELGAERLFVIGDRSIKGPELDAQISDDSGMIAQLPTDPKRRAAIFHLYAKQVRIIGWTPHADTGQKYLFLYWPPPMASSVP